MATMSKVHGPIKIDVRRAVDIASSYFRELFPAHAKMHMMLEEIEESSDGKRWLVTLGYDHVGAGSFAFQRGPSRDYKTVTIDSATGKVVSVKIRSLA